LAERASTRGTVLIAGAANITVGAIKLAAGVMVGSSAMLAEAAHSAADTLNQAFLLTSVRRGERPADSRHPFGYGQERYFWSLLAAFGIFVAGGGFSIFQGVLTLGRGSSGNPLIAYVVLAVSGLAEGTSLVRVLVQLRGEARRGHVEVLDHVRRSPDTTVKATLFEDSAAMIGLGLAALGLALRQVTGSPVWDGGASIAIGALLVVVAVKLGLDSRDFLIGRAADPKELELIRDEIENAPGVDALVDLRTMYLGPDHLIVAARVAFSDEISADRAEDVADDVDRRLADRLPLVPHVFLDPTQASAVLPASLCKSLLQARVNSDDAVHAGERDDAEDGLRDDDQPYLTALGPRPPVRGHQGIQPGRVTEPGPGHVHYDQSRAGPDCLGHGRPQPGCVGEVDLLRRRYHRHALDHLDGEADLGHLRHLQAAEPTHKRSAVTAEDTRGRAAAWPDCSATARSDHYLICRTDRGARGRPDRCVGSLAATRRRRPAWPQGVPSRRANGPLSSSVSTLARRVQPSIVSRLIRHRPSVAWPSPRTPRARRCR
jgi:cation diffusion facilitator family transporter